MELHEVASALAPAAKLSSLAEHRDVVAAVHGGLSRDPQRHTLAMQALDEIEAALARLAALGHQFALVRTAPHASEAQVPPEPQEQPAPEPQEQPAQQQEEHHEESSSAEDHDAA